ncbi:hypothetical protein TRFO_11348 [Tritrichomonas foetus]|uniref:FYVE-type domain-containing protein n=1 Tax=Tritrichomonas foetus TaxID=1144522 RepID=A0A1J4J8S7_9EUKA|nr:hypothetical protein TRFO_11348 [Tritrichomonas foetus]|eukprot:OHS94091.1 hypothetical protein TRFO_11348 [Tritrichomonas foetus]
MVDLQESAFDDDFFVYYEHFERVASGNHKNPRLSDSVDPLSCPLCKKPFGILTFKHNCSGCGMPFCSDCVIKRGSKELCHCCTAVEKKNLKNFDEIKSLQALRDNKMAAKYHELPPLQVAVLFFLNFFKSKKHIDYHEYAIITLYKYRKSYISNPIVQVVQQAIYSHIVSCRQCKKLNILIDLFCDISVIQHKNLKKFDFELDLIESLLDIQNPRVSAATARLCLLLVQERLFDPDRHFLIEIIHSGNKMSIAFATAAIAHKFATPTLFEESQPSVLQYNPDHVPDLVKNVISLFDGRPSTSTAAQYFGSIILLKLSESEAGASELSKYFPLINVINSLCLFCPNQLGLSRNEGKIAVYLARMVKNLWRFCEKSANKDKLINAFFSSVLGFIFDVTERRLGYDNFSHLCIVQSIALELVDDIATLEQFREALLSPYFQDRFKEMKLERRTSNDVSNQEKIDFLNDHAHMMEQLTQEQVLQIREREKENMRIRQELADSQAMIAAKETECLSLKRQLESLRVSSENLTSSNKNAFQAKDSEIQKLKSEIEAKSNEINALTAIVSAKQQEIDTQRESLQQTSDEQTKKLVEIKDNEIAAHKKIADEKSRIIEDKEKELQDKQNLIATRENELTEKLKEIEEKTKRINELEAKLEERTKEINARDSEISRLNEVVKSKEEEIEAQNNGFSRKDLANTIEIDEFKKKLSQKEEELQSYSKKFAGLAETWTKTAEYIVENEEKDTPLDELVKMPIL